MNRVSLPEGVFPTNDESAFSDSASFQAPDTATPNFSKRPPDGPRDVSAKPAFQLKSRSSDRFVEDDQDEDDEDKNDDVIIVHGHHAPGPLIILIAIGLVLAALAAFVMVRNQQPVPLCSEQPDWNQYNCRAG